MLKEQNKSLIEYGKLRFNLENKLYNKLKNDCYNIQIYLPEDKGDDISKSLKKKSKGNL